MSRQELPEEYNRLLEYTDRVSKSLLTWAYFMSMWSRGIRTLSSCKYPLSIPKYPNFGPISPTFIPARKKCPNEKCVCEGLTMNLVRGCGLRGYGAAQ